MMTTVEPPAAWRPEAHPQIDDRHDDTAQVHHAQQVGRRGARRLPIP
jgi:hypothetical protein